LAGGSGIGGGGSDDFLSLSPVGAAADTVWLRYPRHIAYLRNKDGTNLKLFVMQELRKWTL